MSGRLHIAISERQHMMALSLAAVLLALVLASLAKPQPSAAPGPSIVREPPIGMPARDKPVPPLRLGDSGLDDSGLDDSGFGDSGLGDPGVTGRTKAALNPAVKPPLAAEEIWDYGPVYDLDRTGRSSIYVLYTPEAAD